MLLFLLIAGGVFAAAYLVLAGGNDTANDAGQGITTLPPSTTVVKAFGPYKVTTGVNVRQGAGTNFPSVGTVETGRPVFVACVVEGQPVDGPTGPDPRWLRLTGFGPNGYVTALYVSTGEDLTSKKIPNCPSA